MALQTTVEQVDAPTPSTVVALDGELDGATYEGVIATVRRLYDAGTRKLLLDLGGVTFISSSGLVAVHSIMRMMRGEAPADTEQGWGALHAMAEEVDAGRENTSLRICGTQPAVQKVLDRTGLGGLIPSFPDRESALAGF